MTVDKRISYDVQGGVKNYLGKQKQVTAPIKWKSSPDSPETELAYITKAEKDLLVKKDLHGSLKGGVNRGPSGIMSLDGYGSIEDGVDVGMSGAATSAAESGRNTSDTLAEGASYKDVQDYRNAFIAAGGGQRVNPGFFDSRNTVSPEELRLARLSNPRAFRKTRGGGIMDFFTGGGFLGNIVRSLGQKFGLGKTYDQPTYDMSQYSAYGLGGSQTPAYYDDLGNELMLSTKASPNVAKGFVTATGTNYPGANKFVDSKEKINYGNLNNFGLDGYMTNEMFEEQFGGSNLTTPDYLKSFEGIYSLPEKRDFLDNTLEDYQISPNSINAYQAKVTQDDINRSKSRAFKSMDYDTYKMIVPNTEVTPYEFEQLKKGNITEPGTYTV